MAIPSEPGTAQGHGGDEEPPSLELLAARAQHAADISLAELGLVLSRLDGVAVDHPLGNTAAQTGHKPNERAQEGGPECETPVAEGVAHSLPDAANLADVFIDVCDGGAPHGQVYDLGNGEEANATGTRERPSKR